MKRDRTGLAMLTGLCVVVLATGVRADQEDDKKKAEREWREAEEGQGKKKVEEGAAPGIPGLEDNPLDKILELMKGVEDRLFESDTGDFTQEEQRKVAEAMRFEDKTSQALEELIRKIEEEMQNQQQQQQQSGGETSEQKKQRQQREQQQRNETPEQKREREQREQREKQEEERRRMQQQQQQNQPQNQQQPQNDRAERERQERREALPPDDPAEIEARAREAAGRWGQLPAKLHQDAQNAQNQEPPARWAELIKRYRERLNTSEDR